MPPLMVRPASPLLNTIRRPAASVIVVPIASRRMPSHLGMGKARGGERRRGAGNNKGLN